MDGTKELIRQHMRRRRRALPPSARAAVEDAVLRHVAGFAPYRTARVVLAYAAIDNEVPTAGLIERALADGKKVFLPRLSGRGMTFAEHRSGMVLERGPFGIPQPTGGEFTARADVPTIVFVPLVAWDMAGVRLGRGAGFYDRALATLDGWVCLTGLGYAFQQCSALPREPWDVRLDYAVTEKGVVRCRGGDGASPMRKEDTTDNDLSVDRGRQHRPGGRPGVAGRLSPPRTA